MKYVIIGNSAAAVGCIEGIRQIDKDNPITVITKEKHHTYSRPLISYLLSGKTDEERMKYRPNDFYEKNNCKLLSGVTAEKILPVKKQVLLDDGSFQAFDKLLIATGSRAFIPPIKGLETVEKQFTFMTVDDAKAIQKSISLNSRVLIMGAGLIGLKCAEGLSGKVGKITIVDLADRILPSILDEAASAMAKAHLEKHRLEIILSNSVQFFEPNRAVLASGQKIDFDILIIAVGVRPNTQLISDAGGRVERGIVTDEYCRCSLPDIYAAGDCTESIDITTGQYRVLALLPNAYMQGECAGINMAGGEKRYRKAIPMNAMGLFGLHMITAGSYDGSEYVVHEENTENNKLETGTNIQNELRKCKYKKLVSKDGLLKGYIMLGDVARAGIYTSLIKEEKLLDSIDYELIKDRPQLMAFSQVEREKMLGGK